VIWFQLGFSGGALLMAFACAWYVRRSVRQARTLRAEARTMREEALEIVRGAEQKTGDARARFEEWLP
jgi:hypothetical protein